MTKITEEQIRDRAHLIWEREGRPEGREIAHWATAATELANEASDAPDEAAAPDAPKEASAPKKRAARAPKAEGAAAPKRAAAKPRAGKAGSEPAA